MNTLLDRSEKLSNAILNLQYELEDHYESPNLEIKLEHFHTQILELVEYIPQYTEDNPVALGNQRALIGMLKLRCEDSLSLLDTITATSNVFDIIDILKTIYTNLTFFLE